jgi:hypothetical protein
MLWDAKKGFYERFLHVTTFAFGRRKESCVEMCHRWCVDVGQIRSSGPAPVLVPSPWRA